MKNMGTIKYIIKVRPTFTQVLGVTAVAALFGYLGGQYALNKKEADKEAKR